MIIMIPCTWGQDHRAKRIKNREKQKTASNNTGKKCPTVKWILFSKVASMERELSQKKKDEKKEGERKCFHFWGTSNCEGDR